MFALSEERTRWFMARILPHEPALRAWLNRHCRASADADDVIQETYTVLAARESVDDIAHPRAYLFQVAHSIVVRQVRRARIVSIQAVEELDGFDPADEGASPERSLIGRDELRRLAEAIAAMPPQMQKVFILRRVHGHSQNEVAARLGLSESTVEKHMARGVRFLTDWFGRGGTVSAKTSKVLQLESDALHGRTRNKSGH